MSTTSTETVTVTVDRETALSMIALAGGVPATRGGWAVDGAHYWSTDEALMVALEAIAASDLGRTS